MTGSLDDLSQALPASMKVNVIMERRPGVTRWVRTVWEAVGVTVGQHVLGDEPVVIFADGDYCQLKYGGLVVQLHADESADYYHNLMSPAPGCFVVAEIADDDPDQVPVPVLVTLSFDQANAYGEGGSTVYHVAIPAELYAWVERYVLTNYFPEKKYKRKLRHRDSDEEQQGV